MIRKTLLLILLFILMSPRTSYSQESPYFEKLTPLFEPKKDFGPYGWLAQHDEQGQTYSDYLSSHPTLPTAEKPYLYIVLLGDFSAAQQKILEMSARYFAVYFQTPVKFNEPISLSVISDRAKRIHPQTGDPQVLTSFVIEDILKPRMPKDAFAYIAFTTSDLWPGEGWNFVFGQASMEDRIGVWSIYRNGDPDKDSQLCLRRTIQTGTHEIGHLFGLWHCIYYECNMNGSNSRHESDQRPLWECPVCLRKLSSGLKFDISKRYRELSAISKEFGFNDDADFLNQLRSVSLKE